MEVLLMSALDKIKIKSSEHRFAINCAEHEVPFSSYVEYTKTHGHITKDEYERIQRLVTDLGYFQRLQKANGG